MFTLVNRLLVISKYINIEDASKKVDIIGPDMVVGSMLIRLAIIGNTHPTNLDTITISINANETTMASGRLL